MPRGGQAQTVEAPEQEAPPKVGPVVEGSPAGGAVEEAGPTPASPDRNAVRARAELEQVRSALLEGTVPELEDPGAVSADIARRILDAPTLAEALDLKGTVSAEERLWQPLVITGVKWMASALTDGPPVYAIIQATNPATGEEEAITCSGMNVMALLLRAALRGEFPFAAQIEQATKATAQGYYPLWLKPTTLPGVETTEEA